MESLRFLKCVLSYFSFVKMLLGFMIPGMWSTSTTFDWWNFQTIFSLRFKCLIHFEVMEAIHLTAVLFFLYIFVLAYASGIPMPLA